MVQREGEFGLGANELRRDFFNVGRRAGPLKKKSQKLNAVRAAPSIAYYAL
jgi:hypothetical protein